LKTRTEIGFTPLIDALSRKNFKIAKLLISSGADVNVAMNDGSTPLIMAIRDNSLKISEFLIFQGAEINHKDQFGYSALHLTVRFTDNCDLVDFLLMSGASIYDKNAKDQTPLQVAISLNKDSMKELIIRTFKEQQLITHPGDECMSNLECPVCSDSLGLGILSSCMHIICHECLGKLKTKTCPICRKATTNQSLVDLA
jgi:hypothetical protein